MESRHRTPYVQLRELRSPLLSPVDHERVDDDDHADTTKNPKTKRSRRNLFGALFLISVGLNAIGVCLFIVRGSIKEQALAYSPAARFLDYENVVFSSAFGIQRSPFQGEPSESNNRLWEDLYDFGITRINANEAKPMANKTLPISDEKGGYVVQLAVFHQLHCLNLLRKGIYGAVDMTNADDLFGIEHLDHCVDTLRQSIMCNCDVTPLTFARTSLDTDFKAVAEVIHTCRNFATIQRWAWDRQIETPLDKKVVVTDDPLGWGTYTYSPGD